MRVARVIFRPEGILHVDQRRSIQFLADPQTLPSTTNECRPYEEPMRIWMARTHPGDTVTEIRFWRTSET